MLNPPSVVSKILRSPHKYLKTGVRTEPPPIDRLQCKIIKPLKSLDASTPWSSWSKIFAAGLDVTGNSDLPVSSHRSRQEIQSNAVDKDVHSIRISQAWKSHTSDVNQDDLDKPDLNLGQASQHVFSPDRSAARPPLDACKACLDENRSSSCQHTGTYSEKLRILPGAVRSHKKVC